MSTSGDHGAFACHVTTAVIFDQLACHGTCTAKLRVVSERRGSDEDEHQGQAFYQDHLISCPALGRAENHTGPIIECGSAATKTRRSNTTRQVADGRSANAAIGRCQCIAVAEMRRFIWAIAMLEHRRYFPHVNPPISRTPICFRALTACVASLTRPPSAWNFSLAERASRRRCIKGQDRFVCVRVR